MGNSSSTGMPRTNRAGSAMGGITERLGQIDLKTILIGAVLGIFGIFIIGWLISTIFMHVRLRDTQNKVHWLHDGALKPSESCPAPGGRCTLGAELGGYCHPDGLNYPVGTPCSDACVYNGTQSCDGLGNCVGGTCKGNCFSPSDCPDLSGTNGFWEIGEPTCSDFSAGQCVYPIWNNILLGPAQAGFGAPCLDSFVDTCREVIPEEHRECMDVEQICTVGGASIASDPPSIELGRIHYGCYATYKCASHAPILVV